MSCVRSRASRRGAELERATAKALGGKRVRRSRFESAPDLEALELPCGLVVQIECKARESLPALVVGALDQARKYAPEGAIPVAVLRARGAAPVTVLSLKHFALIAGAQSLTCQALPVAPYSAAEFLRELTERGIIARVVDGRLELRGAGLTAAQREEARLVADSFGEELLAEASQWAL